MPTILYVDGFRFFFYSNESSEPMHIHVEKGEGFGKWWLEPEVKVAYLHNFTKNERRLVKELIEENLVILKQKWNEFFNK